MARRLLWTMLGAEHPMAAHRADSRAMFARGQSDDAREGVTSFLEKREPEFSDRVSDGLPELFPGAQRARVLVAMAGERDLDVVVFGATGVTGRRVAAYLAERAGETGARWAAAARDAAKLARCSARIGVTAPETITADLERPGVTGGDGFTCAGGPQPRRPLHAVRAAGDRGMRRRAAPTTPT